MQVAVRPYLTTGVALVGAGVIAVSPIAPPVPEIEVPAVHSAPVALTATYAELIDNTLSNLGFIGNDLFEEGIAPILQQIAVNQLTLVQDLGAAVHRLLEASNPVGIPATLTTALGQLAAGQIQEAAETLSTGVILAALPLLPPLQVPINNLVAVINLVPQIIPQLGIALISPPLSLFQGTAAAIQDVVDDVGAGDLTAVVNAIINAPATILDGVINGYPENGFPGLIGANGGALGVLVNIRDMILDAITPPAADATAEEASPTDVTDPVTSTTSDAAVTLTLDVAPVSVETESADVEAAAGAAGGGEEDGAAPAGDANDDATPEEDLAAGTEDEASDETATEDGVTDTDESATEEESAAEESESEAENSGSGTTDGNKVTPGGTNGDDSTSGDGDSAAGGAGDDTDSADAGADGGSDAGSDSGSGDSE
ncbi:MAG TPA: hypothetical protein VHH12_15650 [Mycobacterium sp.]|nr:hypothetical protein [Mycobacterium sp.]